ncbi:MAG: hypothetical protein ACR2JH_02610 [Solirubrobacteraceae bacterium]
MSQALRSRAEVLQLARLLRRNPAELDYLREVPAEDVARLREQVTDVLFGAHGHVLGRLATASKLLPIGVVATIGERAFGPVLSARVAGLLEPPRAIEMAAKLPVGFLADVAVELDPRRASDVIAGIPPAQIAAITRELIARGEHVTMARFVGYLRPEATSSAIAVMDDSALLGVAFLLEPRDGLDELVELLPPKRMHGIVDVVSREDLWPEALELVGSMNQPNRCRFAELDAIQADGVLETIVAVARERQLWPHVLPLVPCLPESAMTRLGSIVRGLNLTDEEIGRLVGAAADEALREPVLQLATAAGLTERLGPLAPAG